MALVRFQPPNPLLGGIMANDQPNQAPSAVNTSYPQQQLAKALLNTDTLLDPAKQQRALEKARLWRTVIEKMQDAGLNIGSRVPVEGTPLWATLEVLTGGFATGRVLAAGPLQEHEIVFLGQCSDVTAGNERQALNRYFLSVTGLQQLSAMLESGCYEVQVPEEAALLVVTWLLENGLERAAYQIIAEIEPYFSQYRFYPIPASKPRQGGRVHLQNVAETVASLQAISPNRRILAQKEAVEVWAPFYDRMLTLILETEQTGQYCQNFPADWHQRAQALLEEYRALRKVNQHCGKPDKSKFYFAQLRALIQQCVSGTPSERQIMHAGKIVRDSLKKRGAPDSAICQQKRQRQQQDVVAPMYKQLARAVVLRLAPLPAQEGLDDASAFLQPINAAEAKMMQIAEGTLIPHSIQSKVTRCMNQLISELIESGLISSGETLARVLPKMSSAVRAAGIQQPQLRALYAATYQAFRRRRSLLLLNLASQVRLEELPWVQQIEALRQPDLSSIEVARQTLEEVSILTLTTFPYAIVPNKLLQEMRALAASAKLQIHFVDELAVDIFTGRFADKFHAAAINAGTLLRESLYANYYQINYDNLPEMKQKAAPGEAHWLPLSEPKSNNVFAELCAQRARISLGTYKVSMNGMIVEQQQILTTQNLASLFLAFDLGRTLQAQLPNMAKTCFSWVCKRHQMKVDNWHGHLLVIKNTAYAWRQMVFFLSQISSAEQTEFFQWAQAELKQQIDIVQKRLQPALTGLQLAAQGLPRSALGTDQPAYFVGWSFIEHWMLEVA